MKIRQQLSFFADLSKIGATPENTMRIFKALSERGVSLLPGTLQEITAPRMMIEPRIKFSTSDSSQEINILTTRLDIIEQYPALKIGLGLGSSVGFSTFAQKCCAAVLEDTDIRAGRLAMITQFIHPAEKEEQLKTIFNDLFQQNPFFEENPATEWTFRANVKKDLRFDRTIEKANFIIKVDRVQGDGATDVNNNQWKKFDRVFLELDTNTLAENAAARFKFELVEAFCNSAADLQKDISKSLLKNFDGNKFV